MSKLTSKQKRALRTNMTGYAFILPNLIGYSLFVFVPVIFSFVLSVMSWDCLLYTSDAADDPD